MNTPNQPNATPANEETRPLETNPEHAQGRRIRGEGVAHEQDYIEERITHAGNTDEYAEAVERLADVSAELDELTKKRGH